MALTVGGKYRVGSKLGKGSFGTIYQGEDIQSGEQIALKFEDSRCKHPQLSYESRLYRILQGGLGIPRTHWYGTSGHYNVMVMELLGPSLEDLFHFCNRSFSLKTVFMIAEQALSRIEYLHAKNFIHRDIKPDNFSMGVLNNSRVLYLIDFGLAKRFRDPRNNQHIPYREGKELTGTARYASVSTHLGIEQSRRDDLEALGYVLVYLLKGKLPWQGLNGNQRKNKEQRAMEKKIHTSIQELTHNLPPEFTAYLYYARSLRFEERPDYSHLKRTFKDAFIRYNFNCDHVFDWSNFKFDMSEIDDSEQRNRQERVRRDPIVNAL